MAALIVAVAVPASGDAIDRKSYIEQNLALLRTVPAFRGARLLRVDESGYKANELSDAIVGYGTTREYSLRRSVRPGVVIAFYRRVLRHSWRVLDVFRSRGLAQLNLRRGNAYLEVLATRGHVDVEVDHDCYKGGRSPVCFGP
jgi:hypothetical protein